MRTKTPATVNFRLVREPAPGAGVDDGGIYICTCDFETTATHLARAIGKEMYGTVRIYVFQSNERKPVYSYMRGEGGRVERV